MKEEGTRQQQQQQQQQQLARMALAARPERLRERNETVDEAENKVKEAQESNKPKREKRPDGCLAFGFSGFSFLGCPSLSSSEPPTHREESTAFAPLLPLPSLKSTPC